MSRPTPIHWDGEPGVLQRAVADVWEQLRPLELSQDAIVKQVLESPDHKAELISICQKHLTARDQESSSLRPGAGNKQLRKIAAEARALALSRYSLKEATNQIQYKLWGLVTGPEWRLYRTLSKRGSSLEAFKAIDVSKADWALLADACEASILSKPGPAPNLTLKWTIARLVGLYEQATGRGFTHNPTKEYEYKGRLYSACDRFIESIMKIIDPDMPETLIVSYLQDLKRSGFSEIKPGAVVKGTSF